MAAFNKCNCGPTLPSTCMFYTGPDLTFVSEDDQLDCDATIDDIIVKIDEALKILIDGNDLTELDKQCLDFDPATITPAQLHQIEINKICENTAAILAVQEQINTLDIGTEIITIDLPDCLEAGAAPCAAGINQYQLINLLILFANMLCDHETRISNLES